MKVIIDGTIDVEHIVFGEKKIKEQETEITITTEKSKIVVEVNGVRIRVYKEEFLPAIKAVSK